MTEPNPELAAVLDAVGAAVERLLAEGGKAERVIVHINPRTRNIAVLPPDDDPQNFTVKEAA